MPQRPIQRSRTAATAANGRDTRDAMAHTNGGTTQYATSATNTGPRGNDIARNTNPQCPAPPATPPRRSAALPAPKCPSTATRGLDEVIAAAIPSRRSRSDAHTVASNEVKAISLSFRRLPLQLRPQRRHRRDRSVATS